MKTSPQKQYITRHVSGEAEFDQVVAQSRTEENLRVAIDQYSWGGDYRPESYAVLCPDYESGGLWVSLETTEPAVNIRTTAYEMDGPVWEDSCLEFFFNPLPGQGLFYLNFENNSAGTMLCGVHNGVYDGQPGGNKPETFRMRAAKERRADDTVWWQVRFFIPFSYISSYFPDFKPEKGMEIAGNFYKCGDMCPQKHYGSWNPVDAPSPNFHVPASFAKIIL